MVGIFDQKEAYDYQKYVPNLSGARLKVVSRTASYKPQKPTSYTVPQAMADSFMEGVRSIQKAPDFDDMFIQKVDLAEDRTNLILGEIRGRDYLRYDNLARLYDDLLKVNIWRLEIPFPENYQKGRAWNDLNKMELQLRDQIRRELKDFAKDTAFPAKDLRESLLEFKLHNLKVTMMGGLDDVIEPDGLKTTERDMHYTQKQIY
jgi:hypothetical protein